MPKLIPPTAEELHKSGPRVKTGGPQILPSVIPDGDFLRFMSLTMYQNLFHGEAGPQITALIPIVRLTRQWVFPEVRSRLTNGRALAI